MQLQNPNAPPNEFSKAKIEKYNLQPKEKSSQAYLDSFNRTKKAPPQRSFK
jgi:hypothetical protein